MSASALCLVLAASFIHATWNLLAKRAGGGAPFVWTMSVVSMLMYGPAVGWLVWSRHLVFGPQQWGFMAVSSGLHLVYFLVLQRGYRVADLSLVYPLARGTGPMLSTIGAILLFGERPSGIALLGAGLVIGGVFLIASGGGNVSHDPRRRALGVAYGLLTGAFIATYTLWDKRAVTLTAGATAAAIAVPPLVLDYASVVGRAALLAPLARRRWGEVQTHWREQRSLVVWVALLNPLSFILVLTALQWSRVSLVAPAREISILIGVLYGARLLSEGNARRRLVASVMMLVGIAALARG